MLHSRANTRTSRMLVLLAAALAVLAAAVWAAPARANLIVAVNSVGDASDATPGDGVCETSPTIRGDSCTLRAAIQETNALPGSDAIRFAIPGTGVHKITPDTVLPKITDRVEINGYSQPGAHPNTNDINHPDNASLRIELSGEKLPTNDFFSFGLAVSFGGSGTVINGLVINRCPNGGVAVNTYGGATIRGNFIGTNPAGTVARGNGLGVYGGIYPDQLVVGGTAPADRNVVSGNAGTAIVSNVPTTVQGNFIGTQPDGIAPLPNHGAGVSLTDADNVVGGSSGGANVIAFNTGDGIDMFNNTAGSPLLRNRIFGNEKLGIDLTAISEPDGVTPNDPLDSDDAGPNELQNFPVLTRAVTGSKATTIQGVLNSSPNDSFTLELFASPPGTGRQGKRFIGQRTVTTGASGNGSFSFATFNRVAVGNTITATATNSNGSTSEFSAPRAVTAP